MGSGVWAAYRRPPSAATAARRRLPSASSSRESLDVIVTKTCQISRAAQKVPLDYDPRGQCRHPRGPARPAIDSSRSRHHHQFVGERRMWHRGGGAEILYAHERLHRCGRKIPLPNPARSHSPWLPHGAQRRQVSARPYRQQPHAWMGGADCGVDSRADGRGEMPSSVRAGSSANKTRTSPIRSRNGFACLTSWPPLP